MESSPNYHPHRDYSAGLVGERRRPVKTQLANLTTTLDQWQTYVISLAPTDPLLHLQVPESMQVEHFNHSWAYSTTMCNGSGIQLTSVVSLSSYSCSTSLIICSSVTWNTYEKAVSHGTVATLMWSTCDYHATIMNSCLVLRDLKWLSCNCIWQSWDYSDPCDLHVTIMLP